MPLEDFDELVGHDPVARWVGLADDHVGEDRLGLEDFHPCPDAEVACLAGRGDDGGGVGGVSGDREDLAAQLGDVLLLDRGEGAVEVDDEGGGVGGVKA